jgi:hypothetical protein
MIAQQFLKQCLNIKGKFDIRHIFIQMAHKRLNIIYHKFTAHTASLKLQALVFGKAQKRLTSFLATFQGMLLVSVMYP